nr:hypothetical protein [Macrococcus goetzii]
MEYSRKDLTEISRVKSLYQNFTLKEGKIRGSIKEKRGVYMAILYENFEVMTTKLAQYL